MRDTGHETRRKAIVLLSGGLDSAVTLYVAKENYECHALIFDYGQKAQKEIECAKKTAEKAFQMFTASRGISITNTPTGCWNKRPINPTALHILNPP